MVLVAYEGTRSFGLCSIYFLCNVVTVKSFASDEKKDPTGKVCFCWNTIDGINNMYNHQSASPGTLQSLSCRSSQSIRLKYLVFVTDGRVFQKHYRFEDFFWTGSENEIEKGNSFRNETDLELSSVEASPFETWRTTTVFHTTTILFATVYPDSDSCNGTKQGCTPQVSPVQTRSIEFSLPTLIPDVSEILPCPTQKVLQTDTFEFPGIFYNGGDSAVTRGAPTLEAPTVFTTKTKTGSSEGGLPLDIDLDERNVTGATVFPTFPLDQKYWILTVLRSDNFSRNLELNLTENRLSTLYKKALNRRQEKYFGGIDFEDRKERKLLQPVKVNILNVTRIGKNVEIIYYVSIAGKPVPAMTAANDMRLMTASEVIAELGYPILSKAEPFIKDIVPLGARVRGRTRDTWLFIGSVIAAVLLLIILATFVALTLSKKQTKNGNSRELEKRKRALEEEEGSRNLAFEGDEDLNVSSKQKDISKAKGFSKCAQKGQTKTNDFKTVTQSAGTSVKFTTEERRGSTTSSSCSGSSEASLVRLRHQQKRRERRLVENEEKPTPKPRTRIRKVENSACTKFQNYDRHAVDRACSAISRNTFNEITTEGYDDLHYSPRLARSPTSYLSMPSVRAFPRGTQIPEPLNKILEPISIRHLDADSDSQNEYSHFSRFRHKVDVEQVCEVKNQCVKRKSVTRHASLEGDDPGFIGPVVWNRHCQKISKKEAAEINLEEVDENISIGRMRRRFNELLDDALSMFGSRNPSPEGIEGGAVKQPDNRVHSAIVRPAGLPSDSIAGSRPKTTGSRRPQSAVISGPRGAWETPSCSTLVRSETAAVFQKLSPSPIVDKNLITVNSELAPNDPAVPLIAAIKNELKKFEDPLPIHHEVTRYPP